MQSQDKKVIKIDGGMFIHFISAMLTHQLKEWGWKMAPNKDNPDSFAFVKKGIAHDLLVDFEIACNKGNEGTIAVLFEKYLSDVESKKDKTFTLEEAVLIEFSERTGGKK